MKCKNLFTFLFTVILTGGGATLSPGYAEEGPIGKIIGIRGTVEFLSDTGIPVAKAKPGEAQPVAFEKWGTAKFHQAVFTEDQFRTGRKSRLKILFGDESLIALGPNSKFQVESYIYKIKDKFRQGVIGVAHGLSMYIINTTQNNKKSSFQIVTPSGNIASRGTQGYISVSPDLTYVANQAGWVIVKSSDPNVCTYQAQPESCVATQLVGPGMGTIIRKGMPPTVPKPVSAADFKQIRNVILGKIGPSSTKKIDDKPMIEVEDEVTILEEEEETQGEAATVESEASGTEESSEASSSEETSTESTTSEEIPAEGTSTEETSTESTTPEETTGYGEDFLTSAEGIDPLYAEEDFLSYNEPYYDPLSSCTQ